MKNAIIDDASDYATAEHMTRWTGRLLAKVASLIAGFTWFAGNVKGTHQISDTFLSGSFLRGDRINPLRHIAIASCVLGAACTVLDPRHQPLAEIPIELRDGMPTVQVSVSGEPLELFLDLGGFQPIALTAAEMARAHVQLLPQTTQFRDALGQVMEAHKLVARDVRLAGYPLGDIEGGESLSMGGFEPPGRNGYIGRPVLASYLLVLDYPKRRVRLYEPGDDAAMTRECGAMRFRVDHRDGTVQSEGQTDFGRRIFLWDTGAGENNIRPSVLPPDVLVAARQIDDGPRVVQLQHIALDGGNRAAGLSALGV